MVATLDAGIVRTADGVPLKEKLRRVERSQKLKSVGIVAPLFLFIVITFIVPIAILLFRRVDNPEVVHNMPRTVAALGDWHGTDLPGEEAFAALAADLKEMQAKKTAGVVGK